MCGLVFLLLNFTNELKIQNNIIISYILVFRQKKFDLTLTNVITYLYYTIIYEVIFRKETLTLKVRLVNVIVTFKEFYIFFII